MGLICSFLLDLEEVVVDIEPSVTLCDRHGVNQIIRLKWSLLKLAVFVLNFHQLCLQCWIFFAIILLLALFNFGLDLCNLLHSIHLLESILIESLYFMNWSLIVHVRGAIPSLLPCKFVKDCLTCSFHLLIGTLCILKLMASGYFLHKFVCQWVIDIVCCGYSTQLTFDSVENLWLHFFVALQKLIDFITFSCNVVIFSLNSCLSSIFFNQFIQFA